MNNPAEIVLAAQKAHLETLEGATHKAFEGAEKWVELHMTASKAVLDESLNHAKAVLSAKTIQEFVSLQTAFFQPFAEKSIAYFQHVQSIAAEGNADFTQQVETKMAETQKAFGATMEQWIKHAPVGTETAVAAFQNAVSQGQKAVEQSQAALKKAASAAQANFAAASKQTSELVKKAAKV